MLYLPEDFKSYKVQQGDSNIVEVFKEEKRFIGKFFFSKPSKIKIEVKMMGEKPKDMVGRRALFVRLEDTWYVLNSGMNKPFNEVVGNTKYSCPNTSLFYHTLNYCSHSELLHALCNKEH